MIKPRNEEIKAKAHENNTLKSRLAELEKQLKDKDAEVAELREEVCGQTANISILHGHLDEKDEQLEDKDKHNKMTQEQLSKLTEDKDNIVTAFEKEREVEIELYKDILFQGFYQVLKYNKPLNLCFLTEEEQSGELAKYKRQA